MPQPVCECEHAAHFPETAWDYVKADFGPAHEYGGKDVLIENLVVVKTIFGLFRMCKACVEDKHGKI